MLETSKDPLEVEASALYIMRILFDGVSSFGSIFGSRRLRFEGDGDGDAERVIRDGPAVGAKCAVGESSNVVGGRLPIVLMMARTGLGWSKGNEPFVDVGKLGLVWFSDMASGLNGYTPVAENAALIVSSVKDRRYAHPNTPTKLALVTLDLCRSSNF